MYWCSPVLVKDSPYTRFLKQITLDFTKGVSMDNLAKNNVKIKCETTDSSVLPITLKKMTLLFSIMSIAIVASILVLIFECCKPPDFKHDEETLIETDDQLESDECGDDVSLEEMQHELQQLFTKATKYRGKMKKLLNQKTTQVTSTVVHGQNNHSHHKKS